MNSSSFHSNTDTKRWGDYDEDDDFLPAIPWAPHVKKVLLKSEPGEWSTVKSKKKSKNVSLKSESNEWTTVMYKNKY